MGDVLPLGFAEAGIVKFHNHVPMFPVDLRQVKRRHLTGKMRDSVSFWNGPIYQDYILRWIFENLRLARL
jgi:hypothetical protein